MMTPTTEVILEVHPHETAARLRRLARVQDSGRVAVRMLAVASAMENKSAPEIARESGVSRRSVQDWVSRYNRGGSEKLQEQGGRGHKPVLTPAQVMLLKARLDAGATEADGVCVLRGLDVKRILAEEFGKVRSLSSVYELLHSMGYNDLMPRPQHVEANPAAQAAFEKKRPPTSPPSLHNTRIKR
jgi:transposase